ncbi:spore germination protein [Brevibacillus ruminantium]|uniref:Spore germination protein n=1 Tax=Brevibacillus ruminantium TaxID=2950604 RepID=A0ABY4WQF5_9BACL|nr:spore germination protein [Brevibacillus ruminantium]USG68312.1 spore germination protein [Brevibacillus ruminantium]
MIGALNINSNSGTINFGDTLNLSPKSTSKSFLGAGSSNTGNIVNAVVGASSINTLEPHLADQVQIGNL